MKIVIAPDSYKESLSALEVATQIEKGFREVFPDADYVKLPVADGGEGSVEAMAAATGGEIIRVQVTGPLGKPVAAFFGLSGDRASAFIEMAAASGLELVRKDDRNPLLTTSFGTGERIRCALDHGVKHYIIGICGSATNGAGMVQALSARLLDDNGDPIGFGGSQFCDVNNPLTGDEGASAIFGPQKGATPAMIRELDVALKYYADIIKRDLDQDVDRVSGAGAAGGMGAGLQAFCGAELRQGIEIVTEALGLEQLVKDASLVITGEGRIDSRTLQGKVPIGVARVAKRYQKPVIGIAGSVTADVGVVHQHGLDAVFSVLYSICTLEQALENAGENVRMTARNIAATVKLGQTLR